MTTRLHSNAARPAATSGAAGLPRIRGFAQSILARHFAKDSSGIYSEARAAAFARSRWGAAAAQQIVAQHSAVRGLTSGGEYGGELLGDDDTVTLQYKEAWRQRALLGQLAGGIDLPVLQRFVNLGARPAVGVVAEGQAIPLHVFDDVGLSLRFTKLAGIVVASEELLQAPGSENWLARALLGADALASDTALLSTTTGVLNGVTPITYGGSGVDEIVFIIRELLEQLTDPAWDTVTLVCRPIVAISLGLLRDAQGGAAFPDVSVRGGTLAGLPLFVTQGAPAATLIAVDGSAIARNVTDGRMEVDTSNAAALEMKSVTTTSITGPTAAQLTPLFQTACVALRLVREIAFATARPGAVAYVSNFDPGAQVTTA